MGFGLAWMSAFILVAVSSLGVVSVGQYYWEAGRMQRIVDLASLAAAREMHGGPPFNTANVVATSNGLQAGETVTFTCMINDGINPVYATEDCSVGNAVQAQSSQAPSITGTIQSSLLVAGLNGLNATLIGGGQLADVGLKFNVLNLAAELGLNSISAMADATASPTTALQAALDAAGVDALDVASQDWSDLDTLLSAAPDVRIGDVLQINLQNQLQGSLNVRLDDFARALGVNALLGQSIGLVIDGNVLTLNSELTPIYSAVGIQNLRVTVLEPPQIFVGRKIPGGGDIASVSTAQLQVDLDLRIGGDAGLLQSLSNMVSLGVNTYFDVALRLTGIGGQATVSDLTCTLPETDNTIDAQITSTLARFDICPCEGGQNPVDLLSVEVTSILNSSALNGVLGGLATLLGGIGIDDFDPVVVQLGKTSTAAEDAAVVDVTGDPESVTFTGVDFPYEASVPVDLGGALPNIFGPLDYYVTVSPNSQDSLILDVINIQTLLSAVSAALGPALAQVGDSLDVILQDAGIQLNSVDLRINEVDCEHTVLTK